MATISLSCPCGSSATFSDPNVMLLGSRQKEWQQAHEECIELMRRLRPVILRPAPPKEEPAPQGEKTLGQVCAEAFWDEGGEAWSGLARVCRDDWQRAGEAVRAAVLRPLTEADIDKLGAHLREYLEDVRRTNGKLIHWNIAVELVEMADAIRSRELRPGGANDAER